MTFPRFGDSFNHCPMVGGENDPRYMVWRTRDLDDLHEEVKWSVAYGTPRVHVIFAHDLKCWHRAMRAALAMARGGTPYGLADCQTCMDTEWARRWTLAEMLGSAIEYKDGWPTWKSPGRPIL